MDAASSQPTQANSCLGNAAAIPALIALRACPSADIALAAALASGVTLGLAVSVGGLAAPVFGAVAAAYGTPAVFTLLCLLPVPAVALSLLLPEPSPRVLSPHLAKRRIFRNGQWFLPQPHPAPR
jgi:hypothetical protein